MIIKVCGMREPENIRAVEALGTDWIGFIFFPKSPRYVDNVPHYLPQQSKRVGVFVNATIDEIVEKIQQFQLQLIQLHGTETPAFCRELRQRIPTEMKIIKMIPIATEDDIQTVNSFCDGDGLPFEKNSQCQSPESANANIVDYFLFESKIPTHGATYGGSGQQFDWSILQRYQGSIPFLLTGGIGEKDAERIAHFHHPQFIGIDLNSRFETAPALKDTKKIRIFVDKIRN